MRQKVVGITCGTIKPGSDPVKQQLNTAYVRAVENAGAVPVILPNTAERDVLSRYLGIIDGLLLSGGVDIAPVRYGEPPHAALGDVDIERDNTEIPLIQLAVRQDMPIFGICRGIQALNVALGGTLYQDLPSEHPSEIAHQQTERGLPRNAFSHSVSISPGTRLGGIVQTGEMQTNSFHHQALKQVAPGLTVTATAPDGVIEALERPESRYLLAVQFHPEETAPNDAHSRALFADFVAHL